MSETTTLAGVRESTGETWVERYLTLLGVPREPPSLAALTRLTDAHVHTVLFENVTSILRRAAAAGPLVPPFDPIAALAGWEARRGGGVCFEVASMFSQLLAELGYRAHLVLGRVTFPGSHQAVHVELEGVSYLCDIANGAPFFAPIRLDGPVEVHSPAGLAYRFRPVDDGPGWVQERWIDHQWQVFCQYDLGPADTVERQAAYQRSHTPGETWVVGTLTLIRCADDSVSVLRGHELTRFTPSGKMSEHVAQEDLQHVARTVFQMPNLPVDAALAALAR